MKAAIVESAGKAPVYTEFTEPAASAGEVLIDVTAAPLSQVTRARASGAHYSSSAVFPFVVGLDGVGRRQDDGKPVYFLLPRAPFGSMAGRTVTRASYCVALPHGIDDVTAAAIAVPAMSSWAALLARARLSPGEVVLVNGATGISGRLAVQIAKHLGARKVIATGRNSEALDALGGLGADVVISLAQDGDALEDAFKRQFGGDGVDVVLDYIWGPSAERLLAAAAKSAHGERRCRFVQIGSASAPTITLPYAALRSCPLEMMGSGIGSVPIGAILQSIEDVLQATVLHGLKIATKAVPLARVESQWAIDSARERTVFVMERN
jgi:NADPH:quinone reductase-like Zn-dependent oxidoreductase